jgi:hypothetical protein
VRLVWLLLAIGCGFRNGEIAGADATRLADARGRADAPGTREDGSSTPPDAPELAQFVQSSYGEATSAGSQAATYPGAQSAGNLNVVAVGWYKAGTVSSVEDSAGNTYELAVGPTTSAQGSESEAIYYACGIAAQTHNIVTVTFMNANQDPDVRIAEYANIATTGCFDVGSAASGSGTAVVSGTLETAGANELLVAADKVFNQTSAEDPTYTTRIDTPFGDILEDRVAAQAGSYTAAATQNASEAWVMQIAGFVAR